MPHVCAHIGNMSVYVYIHACGLIVHICELYMPCLHTSFTPVCIINKMVAYADRPTCNVPPPNPYKGMSSQHMHYPLVYIAHMCMLLTK